MKKELKKIAMALSIVAALTATGAVVTEGTINHDHEWCPLNYVLGLEHQAKRINNGTNGFRYQAIVVPENKSEVIPEGFEKYNGYYGQHVIEYESFYLGKETSFTPMPSGSVYAVDDGFLFENAIPFGQKRVEVYDHNDVSENPQLIRIFK